MIFDQLSFLCLPQDTTSIFAASPHIRPPQDTTASMASHSGFLSRALLSSEPVVYYVLYLIYLANVSLSDFLALFWILLLTAPSARSCKVRESVIHLLATLLGVLRRAFLLLYQRTSFATLLLVFQSTSFTAAANNNNNFLIRTNSNCHYNSNYLLDAALHTTTVTGVSTGIPTMATPTATWIDLHQIYFRFGEHYNPNYDKFHRALDMAYSITLPDIDVLFSDGSTRATFNTDAVQILRNEIIKLIEPLAIATVDKTEITPILNSLPISSRHNNGLLHPVRTSAQLESCCTFALSLSPKIVVLTLGISVLHFTLIPNPRNFSDMSLSPFLSPKAPAPPAPAAPAGDALASIAGTVPVTNIFNYRALPSDVRLRFDLHAGRKMMARCVMDVEFESTIPNMTDPSGATIRTTLSYLDPPVTGDRLITRDGSVFHLAPQGNEGAKEFLKHV